MGRRGDLPTVEELVEELDRLARLSSVEAYYQADFPTLHRVALRIDPRPDDRSGRYAALRNTLEAAIGRIGDESYRDAAQALIGYADRWRSVRSRSTDAGRAFTPSVSYDAFRRRDGRNYRGNTLRATADALLELWTETEAGEARLDVGPDSPPGTGTRKAASATPASPREATASATPASPREATASATPASPREATASATPASPREAAASATPASLREAAASVTYPTAQHETPSPEPRFGRFGRAPMIGVATIALVAGMIWMLIIVIGGNSSDAARPEIDMTRQCRSQVTDGGTVIAERAPAVAGGWICASLESNTTTVPDVDAACKEQYGPSTDPHMDDGWTCEIGADSLERSAGAEFTAACRYPIGSYDSRALSLNRYSSRFVQAVVGADLPAETCPMEPMHYYSELAVGGVTQRLAVNGRPFGAILADDPANVVVITGELWTSYAAVRGLQIYQLGIPTLEDRVDYPAGPLRRQGSTYRLDLTSGGAFVAADAEGPYIWMPSPSVAAWEAFGRDQGCLGLPARPPKTELGSPPEQEFEHATISIDPDTMQVSVDPPDACSDSQG